MVDSDAARTLALALPDTTEQPYHGIPSFRVAEKVFANLPDEEHMHIMLGEGEIREAASAHPDACQEQMWGKKLAALRVSLPNIEEPDLNGLLLAAWQRRAPTQLLKRFRAGDD
ncbi:MAG: hypothetical protein JKY65_20795 [Planctomycetes bacterium]|nr:hypothetical protein [Planctomycetota bacterium]